MEREYIDFEELPEKREYLERVRKTNKPTFEDFEKAFTELGFVKTYGNDGNEITPNAFSRSVERVVGKIVVNGVENLQKDINTLDFRYVHDDFGEVDGDICSRLEVTITTGPSKQNIVFEETVYTRPEDLHLFTDMFLKSLGVQ